MPTDPAALGEFLRNRRDRISPAQAGIGGFPGTRRVPGLRREELARLAGVSADYLRRVEQGRQAHVSAQVLDALARALRLNDAEHAHLRALAEPGDDRRAAGVDWPQRLDPGLGRMLVALEHLPAQVVSRYGQVLGTTELLPRLLGIPLAVGSSFGHWLLTDPAARERILNWAEFASATVAALRGELGRHPEDRRLVEMVQTLRKGDPLIARCWDDYGVRDYTSVHKRIRHPLLGVLDFDIEVLAPPHDPDQRLVVYTCLPGSVTAAAVLTLATWGRAPAGS